MDDKRQKKRHEQQLELAFPVGGRGEAPKTTGEGIESDVAKRRTESQEKIERPLMEVICGVNNLTSPGTSEDEQGSAWHRRDDRG